MRRTEALLIALLGVGGTVLFLTHTDAVAPTASLELKVDRKQVLAAFQAFWEKKAVPLQGYTRAIRFSGNNLPSVFLQQQVGLDSTLRLAQNILPLWTWDVRAFRPLQKTEYRASFLPSGRLVAFGEVLPETLARDTLTEEEAYSMAREVLARLAGDAGPWIRISARREGRPRRVDYAFVWRSSTFRFGEGELRAEVDVLGDRVGGFRLFLHVPETFARAYAARQSRGQTLALLSMLGTLLLAGLGGVGLFRYLRRGGQLEGRVGLLLGGLIAVASLLTALNRIPTSWYQYDTRMDPSTFWTTQALQVLFGSLIYAGVLGVLLAYAVSVVRRIHPHGIADLVLLSRRKLPRWIGGGVLLGYLLAGVFLGFQVIFYLWIRRWIPVWSPAENEYVSVYATYVPALYALTVSLMAGVGEEGIYRLFGFAVLHRLPRGLAFLIPTLFWAFAHATYPVYPVWIRGLELTLGGLLFALVFWRYGIYVGMLSHMLVDTVYFSYPLLTSPSRTLMLSGAIALFFPFLIGAVVGILGPRKVVLVEVPTLDMDTLRQVVRELPSPDVARKLLLRSGLQEAPPWVQILFLARELFGLPAQVYEKRGELQVEVPALDLFREVIQDVLGVAGERHGDRCIYRFSVEDQL
jgi:hypothetical protein